MGGNSRREYLRAIRQRYGEASREEKGVILRESCAVCSYHRKHAIRLLDGRRSVARRKPGRKPVYHSTELLRALRPIWLATDQMCSKKLVVAIPLSLTKTPSQLESMVQEAKLLHRIVEEESDVCELDEKWHGGYDII